MIISSLSSTGAVKFKSSNGNVIYFNKTNNFATFKGQSVFIHSTIFEDADPFTFDASNVTSIDGNPFVNPTAEQVCDLLNQSPFFVSMSCGGGGGGGAVMPNGTVHGSMLHWNNILGQWEEKTTMLTMFESNSLFMLDNPGFIVQSTSGSGYSSLSMVNPSGSPEFDLETRDGDYLSSFEMYPASWRLEVRNDATVEYSNLASNETRLSYRQNSALGSGYSLIIDNVYNISTGIENIQPALSFFASNCQVPITNMLFGGDNCIYGGLNGFYALNSNCQTGGSNLNNAIIRSSFINLNQVGGDIDTVVINSATTANVGIARNERNTFINSSNENFQVCTDSIWLRVRQQLDSDIVNSAFLNCETNSNTSLNRVSSINVQNSSFSNIFDCVLLGLNGVAISNENSIVGVGANFSHNFGGVVDTGTIGFFGKATPLAFKSAVTPLAPQPYIDPLVTALETKLNDLITALNTYNLV